jgi:hypothetical protein
MSELKLLVRPEGEAEYLYRPPMKACGSADPAQRIAHSTVLLSGDRIVTAAPGRLHLVLVDLEGRRMSNELVVTVSDALSEPERRLVAGIGPENQVAYALFTYLEGGDHLASGLPIVRAMADSQTSYAPWARLIMAKNAADEVRDWKTGAIKRPSDLAETARYLGTSRDGPENLQRSLVGFLKPRMTRPEFPAGLRHQLMALNSALGAVAP